VPFPDLVPKEFFAACKGVLHLTAGDRRPLNKTSTRENSADVKVPSL